MQDAGGGRSHHPYHDLRGQGSRAAAAGQGGRSEAGHPQDGHEGGCQEDRHRGQAGEGDQAASSSDRSCLGGTDPAGDRPAHEGDHRQVPKTVHRTGKGKGGPGTHRDRPQGQAHTAEEEEHCLALRGQAAEAPEGTEAGRGDQWTAGTRMGQGLDQ